MVSSQIHPASFWENRRQFELLDLREVLRRCIEEGKKSGLNRQEADERNRTFDGQFGHGSETTMTRRVLISERDRVIDGCP